MNTKPNNPNKSKEYERLTFEITRPDGSSSSISVDKIINGEVEKITEGVSSILEKETGYRLTLSDRLVYDVSNDDDY